MPGLEQWLAATGPAMPQNVSQLPHYDVNSLIDLPSDAAPIGILADGDTYDTADYMLTSSEISLLGEVTVESFSPATVTSEAAQRTFQDNPLAEAIGTSRADAILGLSDGLTGNITAGYLGTIEASLTNPEGNGTYEGFDISPAEMKTAFSVLAEDSAQPASTLGVSA